MSATPKAPRRQPCPWRCLRLDGRRRKIHPMGERKDEENSSLMTSDKRFQRYAIYWTPASGAALAEFGALWLGGIDAFGLKPDFAARATFAPSHYGLHATLKAPFRLKEGAAQRDLEDALEEFCGQRRPPAGAPLKFGRYQRYLTLMLDGGEADVDRLAAECVTHFDRFRAPIAEEDRRRREIADMTPREAAFLERFGYPYVLADFRFHISLAGPLEDWECDEVEKALEPRLAPLMAEPFRIEELTLLGEPEDGSVFQPAGRYRFRG
jgi:hypothetical protein